MAHHSDGKLTPNPHNPIQQAVDAVQGQAIAQMVGGFAVGQIIVYLSQQPTETATATATPAVRLGENPYQGLRAFLETDGDRFFGRSTQIDDLWDRFRRLHDDRATVRILPIYGPSGSGKSSLARAGLIPKLWTHPLPGRDCSPVVVLIPGNHPLEVLATGLARIATGDPIPVAKTREFRDELMKANPLNQFDGLRRIAGAFPGIESSPLILLVDQFEEIYTLCSDVKERHAFVENLLCAASDSSQHVSVILTMRSDFLGATQQHPRLNKLFSSQGFLVPIMQPEELEKAITEPAKRAGYELDQATVQLLLEESQGQDGALPLLQFALTQIWEGLCQGVEPAETLKKIGGVGGALASEAKRLYDALTSEQQRIARSIFLAVIQLHDDNKATRRRAPISELITSEKDAPLVRDVIDHFSKCGVWILVTSCNQQQVEMVEVAHEALIHNWKELQEWLKEHGQALRQKRKIEQAAQEWKEKTKSKDYLLQGRSLRDAREFLQAQTNNSETSLSGLAVEFLEASYKNQCKYYIKTTSIFLFPIIVALVPLHFMFIHQATVLYREVECQPDSKARFLTEYMIRLGFKKQLRGANFCRETLGSIDFKGANLSETDFQQSNLSNSNLKGTSLQDANLEGAFLAGANLQNAFLEGANLQQANLEDANLQRAHLLAVNFMKTNLLRADLRYANLDKSINLNSTQLTQSKLCNTKLPENINVDPDKDCPIP